MIKLQESASAQTVKFISRSLVTGAGKVYFIDEETKTRYEYDVTYVTDVNHTTFSKAMPDLKEDKNYLFIAEQTDVELYRGNVFVTNLSDYSINNGAFEERETVNDFIVYEG